MKERTKGIKSNKKSDILRTFKDTVLVIATDTYNKAWQKLFIVPKMNWYQEMSYERTEANNKI